jgi:hypothetical protein
MMTLNVPLSAEVEKRLIAAAQSQGVPVAQYVARLLEQHAPHANRRRDLVALLQSWIESDDESEQRETGDYLIRSLDEDRLSNRPLFPPELKGVTW